MRPFRKLCIGFIATGVVLGVGVPGYNYLAQERILHTQTDALLKGGWKLEHLPPERNFFSLYSPMMRLQDVKLVHEQSGTSWTAQTVNVPLVPFLPMVAEGLEGMTEGKRVLISSASARLTSHGWSEMQMGHLVISEVGSDVWKLEADLATAGSMDGNSWLDVQARNISLQEGGSRISASTMSMDRISHKGSPIDGMSKVSAESVLLYMAPEDRRRVAVPFPVARSFRASFINWNAEPGSRGMALHMQGVGVAAGSNAIVDASMIRDEDGARLTWKMEGPGVPQMVLTLRGDSLDNGLDSLTRQSLSLRGKLEISDPSGVMRDALLAAGGYNRTGDAMSRSRAEIALPIALVRNGLMDRNGGVAMLNWMRDASRTLVVDISSVPGKPPMTAALTR